MYVIEPLIYCCAQAVVFAKCRSVCDRCRTMDVTNVHRYP